MAAIVYAVENDLDPAEFVDVLRRSTLAERRPADDPGRIARMVGNADLLVTARADRLLVGAARSLTDFAYVCYLADLAVDAAFQGRGIGQELIRRTREAAGEEASLVLLAAPKAMGYYPRVGLDKLENAWGLSRRR